MRYYKTVPFPIGPVTVMEEGGNIIYIGYTADVGEATKKETPVIKETFRQLSDYFDGEVKTFDIPLKLQGTPFQLKTWSALKPFPTVKHVRTVR